MATNNDFVFWHNLDGGENHREDIKSRKRQLGVLTRQIEILEEELRQIERVDEVYKGVALSNLGGGHIEAVDYTVSKRCGGIYQNANDKTKWGASVYEDSYGRKGDHWIGAGWTSRGELEIIVKDWIVEGVLPAEKDRKYR